ncbi:MAG: helix-hairpin-helix domain-containing protein [Planctomycetota bacterium]
MTAAGLSDPARLTVAVVLGGVATLGVWRGVTIDPPAEPQSRAAAVTTSVTPRGPAGNTPPNRADPANTPARTSPSSGPNDDLSTETRVLPEDDGLTLRLDLNAATPGELEMLPRIGPVLAGRIVADRASNGPFRSLSDLQRVSGVGPKTAQALEPFIRFE